jgi:hypothetical protein
MALAPMVGVDLLPRAVVFPRMVVAAGSAAHLGGLLLQRDPELHALRRSLARVRTHATIMGSSS